MGLYNFKPQFVPFIKAGTKKHTIRAKRKHPAKPGETLYLYTGLRTKKARRIIPPVECVKVEDIVIRPNRGFIYPGTIVEIDGVELSQSEKDALARADGFESFKDMVAFWVTPKNRLPFEGHIIHWK